jgi:hypothetical protein
MDLSKQPALLLSVIAGIATAATTALAVATATGNVTVASVVAALGVFIPAATGVLIRNQVVPVARVEQALDVVNRADTTAEAGLAAARELERLTRAEVTTAAAARPLRS